MTAWLLGGIVLGGYPTLLSPRLVGARGYATNLAFDVQAHVSDTSSEAPLSLQVQLAFRQLPPLDGSFTPRAADDRLGYFTVHYEALGAAARPWNVTSRGTDSSVRIVQRWRLQRADPSAAHSVPIKPITYHIDPSVPLRWRPAVAHGIEMWNVAFDAIGYDRAVVALQPSDPDW